MTSGIPGSGSGDPELKLNRCLMCGCRIMPDQGEARIKNKGIPAFSFYHASQEDCQAMLRVLEKVVWTTPAAADGMVSC